MTQFLSKAVHKPPILQPYLAFLLTSLAIISEIEGYWNEVYHSDYCSSLDANTTLSYDDVCVLEQASLNSTNSSQLASNSTSTEDIGPLPNLQTIDCLSPTSDDSIIELGGNITFTLFRFQLGVRVKFEK